MFDAASGPEPSLLAHTGPLGAFPLNLNSAGVGYLQFGAFSTALLIGGDERRAHSSGGNRSVTP